MSDLKSKAWVKKYKPKDLSQYIFQSEKHKKLIQNIVDDDMSGHVMLSGIQGTGKTSLSDILLDELNINPADVLRIKASDGHKIENIRTTIYDFITIVPHGDYRVVQFEEMDALSHPAQMSLRMMMEDCIDYAKFICTCNYIHKIIPALKSRCLYQLDFKAPDKTALTKRIIEILLSEKIKFDPQIILKYVDICYPDLRKVIQTVQQHCVNGELLDPSSDADNDDYKFKFLELLETDDWSGIRSIICAQVSNDEIESVYRFLYENLDKSKKFKAKDKWEAGQVMIADYLYKDAAVSDREINISALFIELSML